MFVRGMVKHKVVEGVEVIQDGNGVVLDPSTPSTTSTAYAIEPFSFSRSPSTFGYRGAIRVSASTTACATR